YLLLLLALTGWTAVVVAGALFRTGRSSDTLRLALNTTLAQGMLLLLCFAAFTALDRPKLQMLSLTGLLLAALMLALVPVFAWWEITEQWWALPPDPLARARPAHLRMLQLVQTGVL